MARTEHVRSVAVVGPTAAVARAFVPRIARILPESELSPFSLDRYLGDRRAPLQVVLCPAGRTVEEDVSFLEDVRRRALWTRPAGELAGAIAGLRGSHDEHAEPDPPRTRRARTTALLLEGDVTSARAESAAGSGAPRHWIVERVQSVRLPASAIEKLRGLGIRWSVLEPVRLLAVAPSSALARSRTRWAPLLPPRVAVWTSPPAGERRRPA